LTEFEWRQFMNKHSLILILTLSLALTPLYAEPATAVVKHASGDVRFALPGTADYHPIKVGQRLDAGTHIKTGKASEAIIVTVPGAAVKVDANTITTLGDMDYTKDAAQGVASRKTTVELDEGTLSALIDPKTSSQTDFKIRTPQGVAAARGTFYAVTVQHSETFVAVKNGKVGVDRHQPATPEGQPATTGTTQPSTQP